MSLQNDNDNEKATTQPINKYPDEKSSESSSGDFNLLDLLDPFGFFHDEINSKPSDTEVLVFRGSVDLSKIQEKPIDEKINLIPFGFAWIKVCVSGKN